MAKKISIYSDCSHDECLFIIGKKIGERLLKNDLLVIVVWNPLSLPHNLRHAIDNNGVLARDMVICHGVSNIEQKAKELQALWAGPEVRPLHVIYWMPEHIVADPDLDCNGALPVYIASQTIQRQIASDLFQKVTLIVEPKTGE